MTWLAIIALALGCFAALAFVLKAPRGGWEAIGAALLLGLAGYALQGRPGQPAAPHADDPSADARGAVMVDERRIFFGAAGAARDPAANSWVMIGDALVRHGQYANAATILRGAVEKDPGNGEAWLALANALVGHADGALSPAALYAYRHAIAADPDAPGPPYFLGLALAGSGRLQAAQSLWQGLLAKTPDDAPWRPDLQMRLGRLNTLVGMAERDAAAN